MVRACTRALAAIALLASAGCIETASLGPGIEESEEPDRFVVRPWLWPSDKPWEDLDDDFLKCEPHLHTDLDGDGFTPEQGDCDDCDPDVGPNAVEMPTDDATAAKDENCNGHIDEVASSCDNHIALDTNNPVEAARALDLCVDVRTDDWGKDHFGLERARWVLPDGSGELTSPEYRLGHGVLDGFGPNVGVRRGARLLALSSGTARRPTDPDYESPRGYDKGYVSGWPDGFPRPSASCPEVVAGTSQDGIALELVLGVPQNAEALAFDFDFYTYELPDHFCTSSNDLFVALLKPKLAGHPYANIAFDPSGNLVSVNTVFLEACTCKQAPCDIGGKLHTCALGVAPLIGTGFGDDLSHEGDRGATGWITSTAEVTRGAKITLRFAIQDAANGFGDSTVLLDHVRWLPREPLIPRALRDK